MRHYQTKRRRSSKKKLKQPIRHQSCCDVVMRALDYPKTTLLFVMLLLAAILITIVLFSDVNEDRNPMSRQLVSEQDAFIQEYFRKFRNSRWFGSSGKKEDFLRMFLEADNIVLDIDDIVLSGGLTDDLYYEWKGQPERVIKLEQIHPSGKPISFVFSDEFLYLLKNGIMHRKKLYFNTNAVGDYAIEYREKIQEKIGRFVTLDDNNFFYRKVAMEEYGDAVKDFGAMHINERRGTMVIDNDVQNWRDAFNIDWVEHERNKDRSGYGNIKGVVYEAFRYKHKSLEKTFVIWAKPWFAYDSVAARYNKCRTRRSAAESNEDWEGLGFFAFICCIIAAVVYLVYTFLQSAWRCGFEVP